MNKWLDFERRFGTSEVYIGLLRTLSYEEGKELKKKLDRLEDWYIEEIYPLLKEIFLNKRTEHLI